MATLAARIDALAAAVRDKLNLLTPRVPTATTADTARFWRADKTWAVPPAGSSDTVTKLAADFVNATITFNDITGFTYTPPANADFEIEAWLLIVAGNAATNLPRVGVSVPAGYQYGAMSIEQVGATTTTEVATHGTFLTAATTLQVPAGGVAAISTPYEAIVRIKGRAGATPAAIKLQLAAETAATNAAIVKAGSKMVARTI